jgi:hypothetical protein
MTSNDLKKLIRDMAIRVGRTEALRLLVVAGVSPHTADRLSRDAYQSQIGNLLGKAIKEAVKASKREAS